MGTKQTLLYALGLASMVNLQAQIPSDNYLWEKASNTYGRLKDTLDDRKIAAKVPSLLKLVYLDSLGNMSELGLSGARWTLFGLSAIEAEGQIDLEKENQHGLWQITDGQHFMLEDYFQHNPEIPRFTGNDLLKKGGLDKSLEVMDWYIRHYHLETLEQFCRAWNGGPTGYRTDLVFDSEEKRLAHAARLLRTSNYYTIFLRLRDMTRYLEENGIAHILGHISG